MLELVSPSKGLWEGVSEDWKVVRPLLEALGTQALWSRGGGTTGWKWEFLISA